MYHAWLMSAAFGLVLLNGFFVAAEFSIVRLRDTQIHALQTNNGYRGYLLSKIHSELDSFLSACQFGITLASLGLGWIGEPAFAFLLDPLFVALGITSETLISTLSLVVAFSLITGLHIIIGELAPKSLAIRNSETIALWSAIPLYYFYMLFYPVIWLFNSMAIYLLDRLGFSAKKQTTPQYSTDELKLIISSSQAHGEIEQAEREILENTLEFADLKIADLMHPANEMVAISLADPIEQTIATMVSHRYSRYPVFDQEQHTISGIIHVKDLFATWHQQQRIEHLKSLMRPILSVSPDSPVIDLFRQFRQGYAHFAIIKNEHDLVIGYVTLDNILGALLGNIHDEFNQIKDNWVTLNSGSFLMKGNSPIYALEKALNIELPDDNIHTISGLITDKLERLPKDREHIEFDQFDITIRKIQGHRIVLVKVTPNTKDAPLPSHSKANDTSSAQDSQMRQLQP